MEGLACFQRMSFLALKKKISDSELKNHGTRAEGRGAVKLNHANVYIRMGGTKDSLHTHFFFCLFFFICFFCILFFFYFFKLLFKTFCLEFIFIFNFPFKLYCNYSYPTAPGLMWVELYYCFSFIVTWVILLYASLFLSYCTKIIMTRVILLY